MDTAKSIRRFSIYRSSVKGFFLVAIYIGKDELLAKKQNILQLTGNMKKGLTGEIEVGDLLSTNLPDDTYVISHPVIGRFEPDFLVISPRYGFILIEVKNWSLDPIISASSNGTLEILEDIQNPFAQIRAHVEDLSGYLSFNQRDLKEPYRLIGFAVVHYGFTKEQFVTKFNTDTSWNPDQAAAYYRHHIFRDHLNQNIDSALKGTLKYPLPASYRLPEDLIKDIVSRISLSKAMPSEAEVELLYKTKELDEKTNLLIKRTEELDVKVTTFDQDHPIEKPVAVKLPEMNDQPKPNRNYIIATAVIILVLVVYKFGSVFTQGTDPQAPVIQGNTNSSGEMNYHVPDGKSYEKSNPEERLFTEEEAPMIKGNINKSGEKIYHVPGGEYYEKTVPEEWFFTEEEAISAGYRKSQL
jgi:hypothetical protein